jgi:hypothetical protein
VETTAHDAAEAATREKAAFEAKMSKLESDLRTAMTDLATTSRQFSQVMNQLQVATEEVSRRQDSNAKLSQDLDGKLDGPPALDWFRTCFMSGLDSMFLVAGLRLIRIGMVVQLATAKQERNTARGRLQQHTAGLRGPKQSSHHPCAPESRECESRKALPFQSTKRNHSFAAPGTRKVREIAQPGFCS